MHSPSCGGAQRCSEQTANCTVSKPASSGPVVCCRQVLRGADRNELNYCACPSPLLTGSVGGGGWHYRTSFLHVFDSFVPFTGKAQQCVVNLLVRHLPQGGRRPISGTNKKHATTCTYRLGIGNRRGASARIKVSFDDQRQHVRTCMHSVHMLKRVRAVQCWCGSTRRRWWR